VIGRLINVAADEELSTRPRLVYEAFRASGFRPGIHAGIGRIRSISLVDAFGCHAGSPAFSPRGFSH
jgi:hypothetical protein